MSKFASRNELPASALHRVFVRRALTGILCAAAALLPALAGDLGKSSTVIPQFMQSPGVGWTGYARGEKPSYEHARTFAEWSPPLSGLGPITDDPQHPYYNNQVARETASRRPTASRTSPTKQPRI